MAMIANEIKNFLTIKIKPRDDNVFDQYSRIFMVKVLLVCSMVTGISWYADKFNCIIPPNAMVSEEFPDFVGSTCWIRGVYIHPELMGSRDSRVAYYGITKDVDENGIYQGELCNTHRRIDVGIRNEHCVPMKKLFFLQYQYMPFLIAALALLYYIPYLFHKLVNRDIVHLKKEIEKEKPDPSAIFKSFFKKSNKKKGGTVAETYTSNQRLGVVLIKIGYLVVNILALIIFDSVLNGKFVNFGTKLFKWTSLNNIHQYDYMGPTGHPNPANEILPPFGYCELTASAQDIRESLSNHYTVVCELSQHVLFQYTLILLWLVIVVGIAVAIAGVIFAIFKMVSGYMGIRALGDHHQTKKIYKRLTPRKIDYLEFLCEQNTNLYGEVLALITQDIANNQDDDDDDENRLKSTRNYGNMFNDKRLLISEGGRNGGSSGDGMELTKRPGYEI